MENRVVITGIGPVSACGIGKEEFFSNLYGLKKLSVPVKEEFEKTRKLKTRFYVPSPEIDYSQYEFVKYFRKDTPENAKMAVLAADLARLDAGIERFDEDTAVVMGTGMIYIQSVVEAYIANHEGGRFNRMTIPSAMPNAPAAWISIANQIHGECYTINTACASGTNAVGEAFRKIKYGITETAIAGGVECLRDEEGAIIRGFDVLTALTKCEDGRPRPFDTKRSGFLYNEGAACCLILESYQHAKKRDAFIYAEITDYCNNTDAFNILVMDSEGEQIRCLLKQLTKGERIDYYNAHGTGTGLNDETEAKFMQELYGDKENQPYVNSTKGIIGHSIGASGAIEAAVCAYSIANHRIHGNDIEDPISNLNVPLESCDANIHTAVSTSFGFGGHNAGLVFRKMEETNEM